MANDYGSQTFAETHWRTATECRFDGINIGSSRVAESGVREGDRHARRDVFAYAAMLGIEITSHRTAIEEALASDHQAILDAYMARRTQVTAPSKHSPAFAPPELLDDDTPDKDSCA